MPEDINLQAPAFGPGSQKIEPKEAPVEASEEAKPKEEVQAESSVEEGKVPYSRFKKFHDEALEARKEAEYWRERAEYREPAEQKTELDVPDYWQKLYGDSPEAQQAWKIQSEQNEALIGKARQEAIEAVKNERYQEVERIESNVEILDNNFETLSEYVGRDLTEKEQSAILDIVDEFTPKDRDGNYAGDIIPFDKAWEIYELKQERDNSPKKASKNNVASLSGSSSQGNPDQKAEQDKTWNPLDWGAYRRRL